MRITDWPLCERPREKLIEYGASALSEAELLAICLGSGFRGKTALCLAREMLENFDGLSGVMTADRHRILAVKGLGPAGYARLRASLELARRHLGRGLKRGQPISSPQATRDFLRARLGDRPYEVFCCLYLDNRNRLISFEELFRGTIDGTNVHPREVVRRALGHNAAAIIFAHNHPSGVAEPSQADQWITDRLKQALGLVDIRVLDHLIVGDTDCVSFAERGLL